MHIMPLGQTCVATGIHPYKGYQWKTSLFDYAPNGSRFTTLLAAKPVNSDIMQEAFKGANHGIKLIT